MIYVYTIYIHAHSSCDTKSAWCIVKLHKSQYHNLHCWNREFPLNRHQQHNGGPSEVAPICQEQINWSCSRHLNILSNDTSSCGGETHLWSQIIPGAYSKKTHLSKRGNPPFCGTTNVFFREAAIANHLSCDQKPWKNCFVWRVQYTSVLYYTVLSSYEKDHNKPANQDIYLPISIQLLHQNYRFVPFIGQRSNEKIEGSLTSRRHHRLPIQWNFSVGVPADLGMQVKTPLPTGSDWDILIPVVTVTWKNGIPSNEGDAQFPYSGDLGKGQARRISEIQFLTAGFLWLSISPTRKIWHFGGQQSLATPRFGVSFSLRCQVKWLSV